MSTSTSPTPSGPALHNAISKLVVYFSLAYVSTDEEFPTFEKARYVAARFENDPTVELRAPKPCTVAELADVHELEFIEAIQNGDHELSTSHDFEWDEKLFEAVSASTGGMRSAALTALEEGVAGSLSSGLHHARAHTGAGYCVFNGLVVAALAARSAGAKRVLILDLDAHCGGGTASLIADLVGIEQVDVSVHGFDSYSSTENAHLTMATGKNYLQVIGQEIEQIAHPETIDLVLYNAGMDPHEHAGGLIGITSQVIEQRESMVFDWLAQNNIPVAFTLAGGYLSANLEMDGLVDLHAFTLNAASALKRARG